MGCLVRFMALVSISTFLSIGARAQAGQQGAQVLQNRQWNGRLIRDTQILPARLAHPHGNAAATAVDIQSFIHLLSAPFPFPMQHHRGAALWVVGVGDFYGPNMSATEGARALGALLWMVFE